MFKLKEPPVLLYHGISYHKDETTISPDNFKAQMEFLKKNGYQTILPDEMKNPPKKAIILTFDDGYKSIYDIAFPLLSKFGFKAMVFLVSSSIGKEKSWGKEKLEMLSGDEIKKMAEYGIEFGAHTISHPHLTEIPLKEAEKEIKGSKIELERILDKEIGYFAYPYGEYNKAICEIAKEAGFKLAFACDGGDNTPFAMRRIVVFPHTNISSFKRKVSGYYPLYRRIKRYLTGH